MATPATPAIVPHPLVPPNLPKPGGENFNKDHVAVAAVQKNLTDAANAVKGIVSSAVLDPKRTDGVYDDNTKNAIKALQKKANVPESGDVDSWLLALLGIPKPEHHGFVEFMTKKHAGVPNYGWVLISAGIGGGLFYFLKRMRKRR